MVGRRIGGKPVKAATATLPAQYCGTSVAEMCALVNRDITACHIARAVYSIGTGTTWAMVASHDGVR